MSTTNEALKRRPDFQNEAPIFDLVVASYQTKILHYIQRLVKDAEVSADLLQDTLLVVYTYLENRAWPGYEKCQSPGEFLKELQPLIYAIARNKAVDELRRRKRIRFVNFQSSSFSPTPFANWQEDSHPTIEFLIGEASGWARNSLENRVVISDELTTAIAQVGRKKLLCLFLYLDGYSYKEIGEYTGQSMANVKSKIYRGKQSLRQLINELN